MDRTDTPQRDRDVGYEQKASAKLVAQAITRLLRALPRLKAQMDARAQAEGVNTSGLVVLRPLIQHGPQRSSTIAEVLGLDPSWISRQVNHLVQSGLVERRIDQHDGRAIILAATPAGEAAYAQMQRISIDFLAGRVEDWSDTDRQQLAALLDRLATELENSGGAGAGTANLIHDGGRRSHE
jgi:DNA-binding MarR family transcriptional regulator